MKPGWARINLHYTLDDRDLDFIMDTIDFISTYGERFLSLYGFNIFTGDWYHKDFKKIMPEFSLHQSLLYKDVLETDRKIDKKFLYTSYLDKALEMAKSLPEDIKFISLDDRLEKLCYFYVVNLARI
jgi:hypothetical protein